MKKIISLLLLGIVFLSCEKDSNPLPAPNYTIEGRWLWSPSESREDVNTMYEFLNGTRYTYYCDTFISECDETYWDSLEISDAIPGTESYTFENNILTLDGVEQEVSFDCEKVYFENWHYWRLNSDCN